MSEKPLGFLGEGREHRFFAGLRSFATDPQGNHLATFYIMNTSANRNRWGVTDKALEEALPTLKGVKLGMGAGYKFDKHYPAGKTMDSGFFIGYEKPGAYALGTAKIEDPKTWSMMQKGELGPVSVVINSYHDTCSACNANLSAEKDPFGTHKCFQAGDAYAKVESFKFARVDFVDVPAYPQAGVLDMSAKLESKIVPLELLAGFYVSQPVSQEQSQKGPNQKQKQKEEKQMSEKEIEAKLANAEQALKEVKTELSAAVTKATDAETKMNTMKAQLDAIQKEKHDSLVAQCFEARIQAGITGKAEDEKTMLAKLSDETLALLRGDALKVAQTLNKESPAPKTRYAKTSEEPLEAAVKEMRAKLGFPERTPKEAN